MSDQQQVEEVKTCFKIFHVIKCFIYLNVFADMYKGNGA